MIGIYAQTRDEVATLLDNVEVLNRQVIGSLTIYKVSYNNNTFYVVLEGVGKANAAFGLGYTLKKLCINKVIVVGNAASLVETTAAIGSVAIATNSIEWDVNFINLGEASNTIPGNNVSNYPTSASLLRTAVEASNGLGYTTVTGDFASGDTFVASTAQATQINTATGAEFLDINTAPIGQISYQMKIPYISVKGISNYATDTATTDYNANSETANNLANRVVLEMLETLFTEVSNECENEDNTTGTNQTIIACPTSYYNPCCNRNFRNRYFGFFW